MAPRVAVIGAGPLGLISTKNLLESDFDVVCFDRRPYVGGLWKPATDSQISVVSATAFNSSRFRSAIPDFPFPDDTDDFPTNQQLWGYFNSYADHFNLRKHIKLNAYISAVGRAGGKWVLQVSYNDSKETVAERFDKLLVASGSFITPKMPTLNGIEDFGGKTIHARDFNCSPTEAFDDKNVLVIGLHATAQDVVCELAGHAKQVYIAHKNGTVILPRYNADQSVYDTSVGLGFLFFQQFASKWFPGLLAWFVDTMVAKMSMKGFPKQKPEWKLLPAPSMTTTTPLIADALWPHLESGFAEPCAAVKQIVDARTVILDDGRILKDIDAIICCTGYDFATPFLPPEFNPYPVIGENPKLYQNVFSMHPDPAVRDSLAFIGHAAVAVPGFAMWDLYASAIVQTWLGRSPLPSLPEMKKWLDQHLKWRAKLLAQQKQKATFYTAHMQFSHLEWLDQVAGTGMFQHFGWLQWRAWRFWWKDSKLYKKCIAGVFSPAMWRLFDMGKRKAWPGARDQIFIDNVVTEQARLERVERKKREPDSKKS